MIPKDRNVVLPWEELLSKNYTYKAIKFEEVTKLKKNKK
jgi:hypothetical protein